MKYVVFLFWLAVFYVVAKLIVDYLFAWKKKHPSDKTEEAEKGKK